VTAFCLFYLVPTFMWRDIAHWPSSRLNLGLDLKGGMHIVYGVKTEKAIYDEMVRMKRELTDVFKRKGIKLDQARVTDEGELLLTFGDENNTKRGLQWVKEELQSYEIYGVDDTGFNLRMNQDIVKDVEQTALEQAKEKIVRRVDLFGVREPSITTQGTDRIAVKLPDIWDPDKAKKLLGTTAVLHFKIVPDNKHIAKTKEELLARFNNKIPEGYEIHPQKGDDRKTVVAYFMLKKEPETTGKDLIDARPGFDDKNLPCVNFQFNDEGARQFGKITAANMDKPLAIILDGEVMSSPVTADDHLVNFTQTQINPVFRQYVHLVEHIQQQRIHLHIGFYQG